MVEADLSQVEERLMSDSNLYEELLILEDETIDRYVRGEMSEADRASFESYFLRSAEHQQKVRFAKALTKTVDRAAAENRIETETSASTPPVPEPGNTNRVSAPAKSRRFLFWPFQNPILNYAFAFVLLIAIGGLAWTALKSFRPTGPGRVFEATLAPGGVTREGGGEIQTITIPSGTDTLRLQLILPREQYQVYQIDLRSQGISMWTSDQLTATEVSGRRFLRMDIPATNLRRDGYQIKLSARSTGAFEEITSYNFRILRQ
jgi:hypothetical protein